MSRQLTLWLALGHRAALDGQPEIVALCGRMFFATLALQTLGLHVGAVCR